MCGIAGAYFTRHGDPLAAVEAMCERMRARGPDAFAHWRDTDAGLAFGHRRLAIIDPDPRANQPMHSGDGRYVIVFNGEIYNYQALRAALVKQGVTLRTTSDTEVVLESFARQGPDSFKSLRGMFALAIWDRQTRKLLLARDPYGIKPLYLGRCEKGTLFASQVKGVQASGTVSAALDPAGAVGFFLWGSVPEPFTIRSDIRPVPSGTYVYVDERGAGDPVVFADVRRCWNAAAAAEPDIGSRVRAELLDSVRAHLVADVPVAVLLSGGVDSATICGLMSECGQDVEGVTVSFREFLGNPSDESPRARQIARHFGVQHTVRAVDQAEFQHDLPRILNAMDQPSIDGVNTWFAAKGIAERGYKVALSGVGGDELFCGYDTFQTIPMLYKLGRLMPKSGPLQAAARACFAWAAKVYGNPKIASIPDLSISLHGSYMLSRGLLMPSELTTLMDPGMLEEGLRVLLSVELASADLDKDVIANAAVGRLESTRYLRNQLLRDADWASMAHSIELRTPLVDWKLLSSLAPFVAQFSRGRGKELIAASPRNPMPANIAQHEKTGFNLPMAQWLRSDVAGLCEVPPSMRNHWSRQWAWIVAEEFGFKQALAA